MNAPDSERIVEILEAIARLLELKGENPFKVRAYANAARAIETFAGDLGAEAEAGRLAEIPGVGKAIAEKLDELLRTGRLAYYEQLRDEFPPEIFQLFELQGLGPKKIKALYDQLQVYSVARLERAIAEGKVAALPSFGEKTAANLRRSIEQRRAHVGMFTLGHAAPVARELLDDLRGHPAVSQVEAAGSYRRCKEVVHDLDFVVATREPGAVGEDFARHPLVAEVLAKGETKVSVRLKDGLQCDLRLVTNDQFPFALAYFTGSKEHNVALRARAQKRGWTLNEYRLAAEDPAAAGPPAIRTEAELHRALGLDYIEPELRENLGEIEAAERGELPRLLEWSNLRGTFHCHTRASDGHDNLERMAEAARELGLEYLGIADHSRSSFQANGLDAARLAAQREEIDALNARFAGSGFRLFAGTECDILKDGSLDFSDEVLAGLDYVVASVHASFGLPQAEMTRRIVRAMENPHVTMLGHATGRLLLAREPYQVDLAAVIDAAAATGTWIELNCNPKRLDLDWRWWRRATEKGVRCVINPDAHRAAGLADLLLGAAVARKGWLRREDVVNCLPLGKIEAALGEKRALQSGGATSAGLSPAL